MYIAGNIYGISVVLWHDHVHIVQYNEHEKIAIVKNKRVTDKGGNANGRPCDG